MENQFKVYIEIKFEDELKGFFMTNISIIWKEYLFLFCNKIVCVIVLLQDGKNCLL